MCWSIRTTTSVSSPIVSGPLGGRRSVSASISASSASFPLVEFVGGTYTLDDPRHAIGVAIATPRHPNPSAEIYALDTAVLPDSQRGPPGHGLDADKHGRYTGRPANRYGDHRPS